MPNDLPSSGRYVQYRTGVPTVVDFNAPLWPNSSTRQTLTAVPQLQPATYSFKGKGLRSLTVNVPPGDPRFPRGPRVSGRQGTLDITLKGGALDTVSIVSLQTTATTAVLLSVASGEVNVTVNDVDGTAVGVCEAASLPTMVEGTILRVQAAWNSVAPIEEGLHMKVLVNGRVAPAGDYSTLPVTPWTYLQPTEVNVPHAFNGELLAGQLGSAVLI